MSFHRLPAGSAQVTAKLGKSKIFPARVARCGIRKGEVLEMKYVFPHFPFPDSLLCLRGYYIIKPLFLKVQIRAKFKEKIILVDINYRNVKMLPEFSCICNFFPILFF